MRVLPDFTPGKLHSVLLAPSVALDFRYIPPTDNAGFCMGSRHEESGSDWSQRTEQPVHRVKIAPGFWLGETPVTQAQFALWTTEYDSGNKNRFPEQLNHPAENLTWRQAVRFCSWITKRMLLEKSFPAGVNLACLPTRPSGNTRVAQALTPITTLATEEPHSPRWEVGTKPSTEVRDRCD